MPNPCDRSFETLKVFKNETKNRKNMIREED